MDGATQGRGAPFEGMGGKRTRDGSLDAADPVRASSETSSVAKEKSPSTRRRRAFLNFVR
jgi:hypothetical protein